MAIQTLSHNYAAIIDELAQVKADIAELARREDALKKQVIELGVGTHPGKLFQAAVSIACAKPWTRKRPAPSSRSSALPASGFRRTPRLPR